MRLLTKQEIDKAKAAEQKREIDEGLKLARRVDNLREVAAQEDASLTQFRKKRVAEINAEITGLETKKGNLISEISQLERARKELMKPLEDQWEEIHEAQAQLVKDRDELVVRETMVTALEQGVKKTVAEAADSLARAVTREERSAGLLLDANQAEKEAKTALKSAREIEDKALSLKKDFDKELAERDMAMAAKERGLEMRESNLRDDEARLVKEWELLEDRKKTFERTITRKNK